MSNDAGFYGFADPLGGCYKPRRDRTPAHQAALALPLPSCGTLDKPLPFLEAEFHTDWSKGMVFPDTSTEARAQRYHGQMDTKRTTITDQPPTAWAAGPVATLMGLGTPKLGDPGIPFPTPVLGAPAHGFCHFYPLGVQEVVQTADRAQS